MSPVHIDFAHGRPHLWHRFTAHLLRAPIANQATYDQFPTNQFIRATCIWIPNKEGHVREVMRSRKGWEVWAELELLFALRQAVGNHYC